MNRFTKGKGLFGSIRSNGSVSTNTLTSKTTATTLTDAAETSYSGNGCDQWWFACLYSNSSKG
jgi:hypothetical protein